MESRTQGSRPRTQKKILVQGQGPRTLAQVLSKKNPKKILEAKDVLEDSTSAKQDTSLPLN